MNNIDETPKVALHNIDKSAYIKSLADAERQISEYKNIARFGISNTMRQRFNINGDCFQIFDKRAGGVLFKDWEWEQIPSSNLLKELFETKQDGFYNYCIETDEGKMLRGVDTYCYFLANKCKSQDVTVNMVVEWARNNIGFFKHVLDILPQNEKLDCNDRRLVLGVLDNARNLSLIMLNAEIVNDTFGRDIFLGLSTQMSNPEIKKWCTFCQAITKYMGEICFSENIDGDLTGNIKELLCGINQEYGEDVREIIKKGDPELLNKSFRSYREIDNYIENYIAITYAIKKIKETNPQILNRQINFIGATYGGLELPFIASDILDGEILTSAIVLQSKYKDRKSEDYLSKNLDIKNVSDYKRSFNILGDDNILTGKTLQSMINLLFSNEISVNNVAIVRYPSINRVEQMIAENSAVDTTKFFNYIEGLVFSSPYTKIKPDNDEGYVDALGIFNKDRRRLLEYIYKNGKYSKDSEVASIGTMYKRR